MANALAKARPGGTPLGNTSIAGATTVLINFFFTLRAAKVPVSVREYLTLLQALQARDPSASAQRMREHFQSGLEAAN